MIQNLMNNFLQLNHWEIGLLATGLLLQGAIFAIFPEELIMLTLGALSKSNHIQFLEAVFFVQLGLLPANSFMVFLGNRLCLKLFTIKPFSLALKQSMVTESLLYLKKYGSVTIFLTRFIPIIRGPMYFAIGLSKIKVQHFFTLDFIASCIQVPLLIFIGSSLLISSETILRVIHRIGLLAAIAIPLIILLIKFKKKSTNHSTSL